MSEVQHFEVISGSKVATPTKKEMAAELAKLVGVDGPSVSRGSSISPELLGRLHASITGTTPADGNAYRAAESLLAHYGLTYDPTWDTSEARGKKGGSTVTNRAFSRLLVAQRGAPRCFVLNSTDAKEGNAWETDKERRYSYDRRVTGRAPFTDAGPGSLVIFYNTSSHSRDKMSFTATARVEYIGPDWDGPWHADLTHYEAFTAPVPAGQVDISGRNRQHAITEITWELYQAIVEAGTGSRPEPVDVGVGRDVGGARAAEHISEVFRPEEMAIVGGSVPARRDAPVEPAPEVERMYSDDGASVEGEVFEPRSSRSSEDRRRDKVVEERAVTLALRHLKSHGWVLIADRQKSGVGYDLDVSDGSRVVHLEVKGIRGSRLEFNLTAKEWWRATTDPDFLVAAVTTALDTKSVEVHLIPPDRLVRSSRVVTAYRMKVDG